MTGWQIVGLVILCGTVVAALAGAFALDRAFGWSMLIAAGIVGGGALGVFLLTGAS